MRRGARLLGAALTIAATIGPVAAQTGAPAAAPPAEPPVPAPAGSAPAPVAPAVPPPPAQQELIYHGEASSLLGRTVRGPQGDSIGRIVDVLIDDTGAPRAAVIDVGGFMGMGTRRIAVAWRALKFTTAVGVGRIALDMSLDQIKDTPDFKRPASPADPPVTVAAPPPVPPAAPASPVIPAHPDAASPSAPSKPE